jgi:hypothetical protein
VVLDFLEVLGILLDLGFLLLLVVRRILFLLDLLDLLFVL